MAVISLSPSFAANTIDVLSVENKATRQYYPVRDRINVTSLDGTWQFKLDKDTEWRTIQVPGNWETQGVKQPEYGIRLTQMTGTYRRTFDYREEWKGKNVILRLDGVQHGFTASVNGTKVGEGQSAHTMHQFDVTHCLREGRNDIEITVDTYSPYWLFDVCDAWSLTGIKRSVELFAVSKEGSLADVVFTSKVNADNSADITVTVKTNGNVSRVTASLLDERYNHVADMQANVVSTDKQGQSADRRKDSQTGQQAEGDPENVTLKASLAHPQLWNAETPNLYRLDVKAYATDGRLLQTIEEKVGIREVRVEGCRVLLNNREIFLRGACLSENEAIEGGAMSPLHRRQQLEQMKAANINFIRTAHYPFDPLFIRLCDEMGFYVCEEIPFASRGGEYLKNDANVVAELKARAKATIDRDRNCPSIILWSHGNENKIYPCQDSVLLFTKEYDPTRLRGVPQAKGAFLSYIQRPSKYVDVICGHYANDGVLAEACEKSTKPIINTEYAHSLGTAFGELEHKYEIFRREPKIAGGSVWSYQDQSILTHRFDQQNQVLKGVRIDSLRYIDSWGINPVPDGEQEGSKEGTDGVVYGDGYPQEDYFELAQVYSPVAVSVNDKSTDRVTLTVENRFDFIPLHGYSIKWELRNLTKVLDSGVLWLTAEARTKEEVSLPVTANASDMELYMRVTRPDGTLCMEKSVTVSEKADYPQLLTEAQGTTPTWLKDWIKQGFMLRVGRPIEIGLDYRRKGLWEPYLLKATSCKTKKRKDGYAMQCRWEQPGKVKNYIDGDIQITTDKKGSVTIAYTLTPSDSINGKLLDYGLAATLPAGYTDVAWIGQGPFSQTPDKTAYNHRSVWQLHKDDIRFYGNRADVDMMAILADDQAIMLCSDRKNIHLENIDGHIVLTDNIVVGTYGTKFKSPSGIDFNKIGRQSGRIIFKANATQLLKELFGNMGKANPEQPYLKSYGK